MLSVTFILQTTAVLYALCLIIGSIATRKAFTARQSRNPALLPWYKRCFRSILSFCTFQFMFIRLVLFALLLLPAFLRIGWWYARSKNVIRGLAYTKDKKLRQTLDIYLPNNNSPNTNNTNKLFPVLFFTGGGAWVVGHKTFCALLGRIFMSQGILVVAPDYRQFPQVNVAEMLNDVDAAIQWTFDHVQEYGGDPNRIYIAGQSAGAHLTSTLVLEHASSEIKARTERKSMERIGGGGGGAGSYKSDLTLGGLGTIVEEDDESGEGNSNTTVARSAPPQPSPSQSGGSRDLVLLPWKCSQLAGYVGISGPYQLVHLREHLFDRGIEQVSFLTHLIGGNKTSHMTDTQRDNALSNHSPAIRLRSGTFQNGANSDAATIQSSVFPPFVLIHGESDNVVPKRSTKEFAKSLRLAGVDVSVKYLSQASHTDPIIEDLLFDESGGKEAGAITELLRLIHRPIGLTNSDKKKRRRRPSMLADGFGYVTDERGQLPKSTVCSCLPRNVIKLARIVNPF